MRSDKPFHLTFQLLNSKFSSKKAPPPFCLPSIFFTATFVLPPLPWGLCKVCKFHCQNTGMSLGGRNAGKTELLGNRVLYSKDFLFLLFFWVDFFFYSLVLLEISNQMIPAFAVCSVLLRENPEWLHFGTEVQGRIPAHSKGTTGKGSSRAQQLLAKHLCWSLCHPEPCLSRRKGDSSRTSPCWQLRMGFPPGSSLIQHQVEVHNKDRLFHFASWAPGWRYSNSVGFFGWTRIFLKKPPYGFL